MRSLLRLFIASFVLIAAAGCRSGSEALQRGEYVQRVNLLCADTVATTDRLIAEAFAGLTASGLPDDPTPAELQALYSAILPAARESERVIRGMLTELRALAAPTELGTDAAALWDAYEARLETSLRRIEEATTDGTAAVELDADDTVPFTPENERASALGFTACSLQ